MLDTPVLFLVFNRPETTKLVFDAIRKARPKQLFIVADGPRKGNLADSTNCDEVRKITTAVDWDCQVKTLSRDQNLGCGLSVSSGLDWFFEHVDKGIILEDDCLPADSFFDFCELMLNKYEEREDVMMVSGTNYLFKKFDDENSFYFSNLVFIWGWATWRRAWAKNNFNLKEADQNVMLDRYNDQRYPEALFASISKAIKGELDTWDVQWAYSVCVNHGLTIVPMQNQIQNIGYIGTHTSMDESIFFNMPVSLIDTNSIKGPEMVMCNRSLDDLNIKNILSADVPRSLKARIVGIIKNLLSS